MNTPQPSHVPVPQVGTPLDKPTRLLAALGSIAAYALCFTLLYPVAGPAVGVLAIVPAATIGGLFGIRAGLLFGLLSAPLNLWLYGSVGYPQAADPVRLLLGSLGYTGVAAVVGWLKGLLDQVRAQARELQEQIARRQQAEEQLAHSATHDRLTNLPNRALLLDRLERALERAKRHGDYMFAVLYLDFDRFKVVNDSLGHDIGDQLLVESAHRLTACVRSVDTVARLGGDEFVILLEDVHAAEEAIRTADRIQNVLAAPYDLSGHRVPISSSIGIVFSTPGYGRPQDLLRDADTAMYCAKTLGRGRHVVFDVTMRDHVIARLELEAEMLRAVERQEFWVHYQPIMSLQHHGIMGFEALVRWQHPERGLLPPAEFLPMAEETHLIIPIGWWVLREACRQLQEWHTRFRMIPPLTISVNLSYQQLTQPDFIQRVARILEETGLDPHSLILELAEQMITQDTRSVVPILEQLHGMGVGVHIDDFGTGYSSLSYLRRLPADMLKIDRSFITRLGASSDGAELIRALVALGHALGMQVSAEGIETAGQLERLRELECEFGQGHLFAEPVDGVKAGALIADWLALGDQ